MTSPLAKIRNIQTKRINSAENDTFTLYKVNNDGSLSNKEHLNNEEFNNWMFMNYILWRVHSTLP